MGENLVGETSMSLESFLYMGGYAVYVWPSYALTAVVLIANVILPVLQRKQLLRQISLRQKREKR
jgi:heme exporter protein D